MKKFMLALALASGLGCMNLYAQTSNPNCDPCAGSAWSAVQVHQWSFTPMNYPGCVLQGEMWYRTKSCNGQIEYEITNRSATQLSAPGTCLFPFCVTAAVALDFEREMILNVLGATNVIRSIPVACWREVELDPNSDPNFMDCWTHHGALVFTGNPMTSIPCDLSCCTAKAEVQNQGGIPWIHWVPLTTPTCQDSIPIPAMVPITVCCETVLNGWGEEVCTNWQTFNLSILDTGDCQTYCSGMLFFEGTATSVKEAEDVIGDNIKFQRGTKVFPNPTNGKLNISTTLPSNQALEVEILDVKGQQVKKFTLPYQVGQTDYPYDVSDLKTGVYFVKIGTKTYGSKVLKIHKE